MEQTIIKLKRFPANTSVVLAFELGSQTDWAITHDFDANGLHQGTMSLAIHKSLPDPVKAEVAKSLAFAGGALA